MKISSPQRLFKLLNTVAQYSALSFSPIHILRTSFRLSRWILIVIVYDFLHNLAFTADIVEDGIQKDHRVDGLQRPLLSLAGDRQNLVHDPADRVV